MGTTPAARPGAAWVVDPSDAGELPAGLTDVEIAQACQVATNGLWARSGRQYGVYTTTVRPCQGSWLRRFFPAAVLATLLPLPNGLRFSSGLLFGASWLGTCDHGMDACGCGPYIDRVELVPFPIRSEPIVKIDGVVQPSDDSVYRTIDFRWLIRTDGNLWPTCQDITKSDTAVGTWSITFDHGKPVPADGLYACSVLARELLLARKGQPCQLARRATTQARQGVTLSAVDPATLFSKGLTGVVDVDMWLTAVNPPTIKSGRGLDRPTRVFRADDPRRLVRE